VHPGSKGVRRESGYHSFRSSMSNSVVGGGEWGGFGNERRKKREVITVGGGRWGELCLDLSSSKLSSNAGGMGGKGLVPKLKKGG